MRPRRTSGESRCEWMEWLMGDGGTRISTMWMRSNGKENIFDWRRKVTCQSHRISIPNASDSHPTPLLQTHITLNLNTILSFDYPSDTVHGTAHIHCVSAPPYTYWILSHFITMMIIIIVFVIPQFHIRMFSHIYLIRSSLVFLLRLHIDDNFSVSLKVLFLFQFLRHKVDWRIHVMLEHYTPLNGISGVWKCARERERDNTSTHFISISFSGRHRRCCYCSVCPCLLCLGRWIMCEKVSGAGIDLNSLEIECFRFFLCVSFAFFILCATCTISWFVLDVMAHERTFLDLLCHSGDLKGIQSRQF